MLFSPDSRQLAARFPSRAAPMRCAPCWARRVADRSSHRLTSIRRQQAVAVRNCLELAICWLDRSGACREFNKLRPHIDLSRARIYKRLIIRSYFANLIGPLPSLDTVQLRSCTTWITREQQQQHLKFSQLNLTNCNGNQALKSVLFVPSVPRLRESHGHQSIGALGEMAG